MANKAIEFDNCSPHKIVANYSPREISESLLREQLFDNAKGVALYQICQLLTLKALSEPHTSNLSREVTDLLNTSNHPRGRRLLDSLDGVNGGEHYHAKLSALSELLQLRG